MDLHPDEGHFSGDEDSGQQPERDEDQGLQIRRTVTQVHYRSDISHSTYTLSNKNTSTLVLCIEFVLRFLTFVLFLGGSI